MYWSSRRLLTCQKISTLTTLGLAQSAGLVVQIERATYNKAYRDKSQARGCDQPVVVGIVSKNQQHSLQLKRTNCFTEEVTVDSNI